MVQNPSSIPRKFLMIWDTSPWDFSKENQNVYKRKMRSIYE